MFSVGAVKSTEAACVFCFGPRFGNMHTCCCIVLFDYVQMLIFVVLCIPHLFIRVFMLYAKDQCKVDQNAAGDESPDAHRNTVPLPLVPLVSSLLVKTGELS